MTNEGGLAVTVFVMSTPGLSGVSILPTTPLLVSLPTSHCLNLQSSNSLQYLHATQYHSSPFHYLSLRIRKEEWKTSKEKSGKE